VVASGKLIRTCLICIQWQYFAYPFLMGIGLVILSEISKAIRRNFRAAECILGW
jgi:hypothetical protein